MTNLNESKRHSRSVRRLGMIASGLAPRLAIVRRRPHACLPLGAAIAFVRTLGLPAQPARLPRPCRQSPRRPDELPQYRCSQAGGAFRPGANPRFRKYGRSIRRLWLPRYIRRTHRNRRFARLDANAEEVAPAWIRENERFDADVPEGCSRYGSMYRFSRRIDHDGRPFPSRSLARVFRRNRNRRMDGAGPGRCAYRIITIPARRTITWRK